MTRPRKPRRRSALLLPQRVACVVLGVAPPIVFAAFISNRYLDYLNGILARSAPIVAAIASAQLGREVQIGSLSPFLSVKQLWQDYRNLHHLGTLQIAATDVSIANGPRLASSGELAYAHRLTADVSVPYLLSGRASAAVIAIDVESARLFLERRKDGTFNIQELVKKKPGPVGPAFVTTITVMDTAVHFLDRATKFPVPQTTDLYPVSGIGTLGASSLRFDLHALPRPGTPTATRLSGSITGSGTLAQGEPGTRPDAARPTDPQYTLQLSVPDADAPFWFTYIAGPNPLFTLTRGRMRNAQVALLGPTVSQALFATKHKLKGPSPSVNASALLYGFQGNIKGVPAPIQDLGGPVRYTSAVNLISFDATGRVFDAPIAMTGSVWNLTAQPNSGGPHIAVRFNAPQIPISRVLTAFKVPLPKTVSISGQGSASGLMTGTPNDLAGTAHVTIPRIATTGIPAVKQIAADLSYERGTLDVPRLTAQTDLGGPIAAQGRVHFGETENAGTRFRLLPQNQISATFAARAERLPLSRVADLLKATATAKRFQLTGTGSVVATGSVLGKRLDLTADVATAGLSLSNIPFTTATARVLIRNSQILVPDARFISPLAGSLTVSGGTSALLGKVSSSTPLSLRFAAHSLDAGRIARIFGVNGVSGIVHATGSVMGTLAAPQLRIDQFAALNPSYKQYVLQSITGAHITVTRQGVTIPDATPITARRFPAAVRVSGQIRNLFPVYPATKARPTLALDTQITDLDYSTVAPFFSKLPSSTTGTSEQAPKFGGTLTQASARITGFADAPIIAGSGALRRLLIGDYPVEQGQFIFSYADGRVTVPLAQIKASVGTITATGTITKSGYVYGSFSAPEVDLSRLSFLTEQTANLGGTLSMNGTFSGTRDVPIVRANISSPGIEVAGVPITDLTADDIQYIANLDKNIQRVVVPHISFSQAGGTRFQLDRGSYDFKLKRFGGTVMAQTDSAATFIAAVRRTGFPETRIGQQVFQTLDALPSPFDGILPSERPDPNAAGKTLPTNHVTVAGTIGDKGIIDLSINGDVYATGLKAGKYAADHALLTGEIGAAPSAKSVKIKLRRTDAEPLDIARFHGNVALDVASIHIGNFVADRATVIGSLADGNATVETGKIVSGTTTINASGTVGLGKEGQIKATVDSNAVSMDLVRAFVPTLPLYGEADLTITATGATQSPNIAASIESTDLLLANANASTTPTGAASGPQQLSGTKLALVRAIARVSVDKQGKGTLEVNDAHIAQDGGGQIDGEAQLPFSYSPPYIPPTLPLKVHLTLPRQELPKITAIQQTTAAAFTEASTGKMKKSGKTPPSPEATGWTGGSVQGEISLQGTLQKPNLSGLVDITDGQFQFPHVNGRETMNPIKKLDAELTLAGSTVNIDSSLVLGRPGGRNGDNGSVGIKGYATVQELESALSALSGNSATDKASRATAESGTSLDLTVTFDKFEPVENNLLGLLSKPSEANPSGGRPLNESFRGRIDGKFTIKDSLAAPTIATEKGAPLIVSDVHIVPPADTGNKPTNKTPYVINPNFALRIKSPSNATLSLGGSLLTIDVNSGPDSGPGGLTIGGSLNNPDIRGTFYPQGGVLNYYLRRFTIDKKGTIVLTYRDDGGDLTLNDVTARTTVYLAPGTTIAAATDTHTGMTLGSNQPTVEGPGARYRITADLQGAYPIGSKIATSNPLNITLGSDPYLDQTQVLSLLIPQSQIAAASQGNVSQALQHGFEDAFQNSVIPGLFSPIEQRVAGAFGLEAFSVDYSTFGPLTINLSKRLPDPLDRFLVTFSRTVQYSGARTGAPLPYTLGLDYELYEIRSSKRYLPHIQLGVSTDEQNNFTGALKVTIHY